MGNGNGWHKIWTGKRLAKGSVFQSTEELFMELKRLDGWDSTGKEITYSAFARQYEKTRNELSFDPRYMGREIKSVFETGCGSGPMLLLFKQDGFEIGGMDYSDSLIASASEVLGDTKELYCGEAVCMDTSIKYDAVFSNSVFEYFPDEGYALKVLEKMYEKTNYSIGVLDVYDIRYKEEFVSYRESLDPEFRERYRGLPKLFLDKEFFTRFAESYHMDIRFSVADLEGYWNNPFVFDCFMVKAN